MSMCRIVAFDKLQMVKGTTCLSVRVCVQSATLTAARQTQ